MTLTVRRVVTGHDQDGKAVVKIDEISNNILSRRPGAQSCVVWATDTLPANLDDERELAPDVISTTIKNGSVFRLVRYEPGVAPRRHRTESIDYAVVMSGEIDMELDDETVHLKAGDVLVQSGTIHNWVNRGTEPCTIAFVLIDARLPDRAGKPLTAVG